MIDPCKLKSLGDMSGLTRKRWENEWTKCQEHKRKVVLTPREREEFTFLLCCQQWITLLSRKKSLLKESIYLHVISSLENSHGEGKPLGECDGFRVSGMGPVLQKAERTQWALHPWLPAETARRWEAGGWGSASPSRQTCLFSRQVFAPLPFFLLQFLPDSWDLTFLLILFTKTLGKF